VLEEFEITILDAVRILLTRTANEGALPFELTNSANALDAWFRAKVQETLDDMRPGVRHEKVEAHFTKRRATALRRTRSSLRLERSVWAQADRDAIFDSIEAGSPQAAITVDECISDASRGLGAVPGERPSWPGGWNAGVGRSAHTPYIAAHRGRGLAATLIGHLVRNHRSGRHCVMAACRSREHRGVELYRRMGFEVVRQVWLHRVSRKERQVSK
jgi:DNA-damage-inducible protein J